jgi:hypothetical protein
MSTVNQEMLAMLEQIYADARGVGTMTKGNAPVNVQELERVITLAKGSFGVPRPVTVVPASSGFQNAQVVGGRPAPAQTPADRQAAAAKAKALLAGKK